MNLALKYRCTAKSFDVNQTSSNYSVTLRPVIAEVQQQPQPYDGPSKYYSNIYLSDLTKKEFDSFTLENIYEITLDAVKNKK